MPSKRQRDQRNAVRAASNLTFKKRRLKASQLPKTVQPQPDDNTNDTSDTEGESGTWYWNESANESGSDTEEEGYSDVDEEDESRTEESKEEATPEVSLMDIRWNRDGESSLRGGYGKESKSSSQRQQESARDLEKEASQTYNIEALWQRVRNLGLISAANSQVRPGEPSQLLPNDIVSSAFPLSNIPRGKPPPVSKQEAHRIQRVEVLKDLNRLLELMTKQGQKYGGRLLPHSNFY